MKVVEYKIFKGVLYFVDNKNCGVILKWYNFKIVIIIELSIFVVKFKLYKL